MCHIIYYFSDGDVDSILNSAILDSNVLSPITNQEPTERSLKNSPSPKDKRSLKDSSSERSKELSRVRERIHNLKDICTGQENAMLF